ncbi:capsule biosynthesis protein CapA [Thioclava sp. SK-1]|uniref:capsule biosynthesis protein n=1 Tax=Thioclava sp. SK-1 TaxID=1889770 RepID=UPI0008246565|nr:capsule biosynthesis protein CapA [Thioclava sp. SK-1]OCX66813.1 capsule biosynthesis protein CapA [Thioclava sp. SK-1]
MTHYRDRCFLLLQGPHGPWFHQLGKMLRTTGAQVWRVGFNRGDEVFWPDRASYIPYTDTPEQWPERLRAILAEKHVTDLVLYGDTRSIHAQAIDAARAAGVTVHVFEEGYLRPYWISYERGGSNGHSRLMEMTVAQMRRALEQSEIEFPDAPPRWGDMRHHVFYGALYHLFVMIRNGRYRAFRPHRGVTVVQEFRLYLRRLLLMPAHMIQRWLETRAIKYGGFPYHLVLLQLEHDASFRMHSNFNSQTEFVEMVMEAFAKGAPPHHHLVFKAHPLEDGRAPITDVIRKATLHHGLTGRVRFVRGGKLANLLAQARSAVTVNSTAAQQVLWRGLPLKAFGRAVFDKPEFVSSQPLAEFFAAPARPDSRAYRDYRHYLLETSQVPGGFYSAKGRRTLLRQVVDMILSPEDPYDALRDGNASPRQQLRVIK